MILSRDRASDSKGRNVSIISRLMERMLGCDTSSQLVATPKPSGLLHPRNVNGYKRCPTSGAIYIRMVNSVSDGYMMHDEPMQYLMFKLEHCC